MVARFITKHTLVEENSWKHFNHHIGPHSRDLAAMSYFLDMDWKDEPFLGQYYSQFFGRKNVTLPMGSLPNWTLKNPTDRWGINSSTLKGPDEWIPRVAG